MNFRKNHKGAALVVSVIFVLVFSALAVSVATISGTNLEIAENQRKADCARGSAQSGLEIVRSWLNQVSIPGDTPANERFDLMAGSFASAVISVSNITPIYDGVSITVPSVTLDSAKGQSFSAEIIQIGPEAVQVDVTGSYRTVAKTIRANFTYGIRSDTVFDFGLATKGPLSLAGNIELEGTNIAVESSVYIESQNSDLALSIIGNSQIAGDVLIANPDATVDLQGGQASIGGETGQDAIDNHVSFGVPPPEFPPPNPAYFEQYAINIVDSSTDTTADATYENIRIIAGTNPVFSGNVMLKGVVFIETPNIVTFTGNVTIIGIIVGNGNIEDNSATNQINFLGTVDSQPVSELPDEAQFAELRNETGTFALAPGFHLSFGGNFSTLSGAIAGNGITFFGNAGGTINGSVINYSDEPMELSGTSNLQFNRSEAGMVPAGFVPDIVLHYDPVSYSEPVL